MGYPIPRRPRLMKALSMHNTIETGTLSGPMHSWASWNDRVQLASLPTQIKSADALPTAYLRAIPPKPSSVVSGKRNSRFARCPVLIYTKSKCLPPLWPASVSESRACHDPPGPGQSLDDEAPFE